MNPIPIEPCTRALDGPVGMEDECSNLQINDTHDAIWGNMMRSAWMPTDEERAAIASGAPVILSVVGKTHPVVSLAVGAMTDA